MVVLVCSETIWSRTSAVIWLRSRRTSPRRRRAIGKKLHRHVSKIPGKFTRFRLTKVTESNKRQCRIAEGQKCRIGKAKRTIKGTKETQRPTKRSEVENEDAGGSGA